MKRLVVWTDRARDDFRVIIRHIAKEIPMRRNGWRTANDEWQTRHRYMQTEPMADVIGTTISPEAAQLTTQAA